MGKGRVIFLRNAAVLTATSLLLRFVGMIFRVWLAAAVGAEGMGLYQQIFSLYMLVSVFASSGVGLAVTRLVSEELTVGKRRGVDMIVMRSMGVTLFAAAVTSVILYSGAESISVYIMSDKRAAISLKIMCASLPFMGVSAVLKGYFFSRKKTLPGSSSQILEQAVRIVFILTAFRGGGTGVEDGCAAVLFGDALAEASSALYLVVCYIYDRKKTENLAGREGPPYKITRELLRIVTPIAGGRYLNTALRTAENILVPACLAKSGMMRDAALSSFGMIKGMALPLLFFPAGLLSSVTSLLVPEMSEAAAAGHKGRIRYAAERSVTLTLLFGIPFAVIFFFAAEPLSTLIYKESGVGGMVKALAPLVPLMYLDSVSDALLKSLDKQTVTFRHTLLDSLGRLAAIFAFLPPFGMTGFIVIMYASNLFTSLLNMTTLLRATKAKITPLKQVILPILFALTGGLLTDFILSVTGAVDLVYIMSLTLGVALAYLPVLKGMIRQ